jgi:hypothetical protein
MIDEDNPIKNGNSCGIEPTATYSTLYLSGF